MHREQAHDDEPDERRGAQHLPRQEPEVLVVDELADEVLDAATTPAADAIHQSITPATSITISAQR